MIEYREIALDRLLDHLSDIDVSEHGSVVYRWVGDDLRVEAQEWQRSPRTREDWAAGSWKGVLDEEGVKAWGAFADGRCVGLTVYRPHLTADMAQLDALFVSRHFRRRGIARQLTALVIRQAAADGHSRLYVSATPSASAVRFYQSQGFVPTQQVHPELWALEPEDIHMIMILRRT